VAFIFVSFLWDRASSKVTTWREAKMKAALHVPFM